jgi:DNA polymerase (family 10)
VHNSEIAAIFYQLADLLEIEGANEFRVRAYRNAARTIEDLPRSLRDRLDDAKTEPPYEALTDLPGIGEAIAKKIAEIVETGSLTALEKVKQRTPGELTRLLKIAGLGPKRVQTLYKELGITNLRELEDAAKQGRIRELHGFGEKIEAKVLDALEHRSEEEERTRLDVAQEIAEPFVAYLRENEDVQRVDMAGSYRRRKETVGDLDILATLKAGASGSGEDVIGRFVDYEDVEEVVSKGDTRSTVVLRSGMQVDLRVVPQESYGAALLYFTGSKAHNIVIRDLALEQGLKVNEYGVFKDKDQVAGESEEEIYELFDMSYIAPELREDRGEIEAARKGTLPTLVTLEDIQGDLQTHTTASDGRSTLKEMVHAAQARGYAYLAITDHSPHIGVTQGLDAEALAKRIDEIDQLNDELEDLRLLKSIEVDILEDGTLDLPDDILAKLDLRVCAIHSHFDLSRDKQTERIIRAMDNPNFNIMAHPTGRRIGGREAYEMDLERVMQAALERGCFLEINAQPERLDLNDIYARRAKEMGLKLAISTDAHHVGGLAYMRFGVAQARRGWLEAEDVLNTRSWENLRVLLKR